MRYLNKSEDSQILKENWRYATASHRGHIRQTLLWEQRGYCAYTERYVAPIDACEIEHFDDRLKGQSEDNYWNWYAVHRWINMRKRRIENYLPILLPHDSSLRQRVKYEHGQFQPVEADDERVRNLIALLGWNDPELAEYRHKFVQRLKHTRNLAFKNDEAGFVEYLKADPENLSFISVLEVELGLSLSG